MTLTEVARRSDSAVAQARAELVAAVRAAAADGLSQVEIARQVGRSQPEMSRLLRFHGTTPLGRVLRRHRNEVRGIFRRFGGTGVRVFGSVARGDDTDGSDIDLLFTATKTLSLMELADLDHQLAEMLGVKVDTVPDNAVAPFARARILREAVPL